MKHRQLPAHHPHGMVERQAVQILVGFESRLVHQPPDGGMSQQQPVELLTHQFRRFAAQDDTRSPQMGLQFVQGRFGLPAFMIEDRQFCCQSLFMIEYRGQEGIEGLGPG